MINFYGLLYALSLLVTFFILRFYFKSKKRDPDLAFSAMVYLTLGTLIGARLVYVLYYSLSYFIQNPVAVFYFWQGGLSFHGGILGIIIAGYFFCKNNKIDFLEVADLLSLPTILFLGLGRIANFVNQEIVGKITNVSWCTEFSNIKGCRHPVQIYLSIKNMIVFFILLYLKKRKVKKGVIFFSFLFLYSTLRFLIDFLRQYEQTYLGLGSGQYLNLITILISVYFLYKINKK